MGIGDKLVELIIKGKDLLSPEAKKSAQSLDQVAKASSDLTRELDELKGQKAAAEALREQRSELLRAKQAYATTTAEVKKLAREMRESNEPTRTQAAALERAKNSAKRAKAEYQQTQQSVAKLTRQLTDSGVSTKRLTTEISGLSSRVEHLKGRLKDNSAEAKKNSAALKTVADDAKKTSFSIRSLTTNIAGLLGATAIFRGLRSGFESIIGYGSKFETLQIQLNSVMGSIEAGEKATAWIKDFTKNTPYQLDGVSNAFVKLKAFGLDPMDGTMQAIADQAAALGGGQEKLEGIVLAVGQAWAKQKLQGEEILQLVERGVPVWDMLAKVTGKNTKELQKLSEKGELGRDVIAGLVKEMGKMTDGAAQSQMDTWAGLVSNAKDTIAEFFNEIAQSGSLDYFKAQLKSVLDTVKEMAANGELKAWAQDISGKVVTLAEYVRSAVVHIWDFRDSIVATAKVVATVKFAQMFSGFKLAAVGAAASMVKVTSATQAAAVAARGLSTALRSTGLLLIADQILKAVSAFFQMRDAQKAAAAAADDALDSQQQLAAMYKNLSDRLGITITSMEEFDAYLAEGVIVYNKLTGEIELASAALEKQTEQTDLAAEAIYERLSPSVEDAVLKFYDLQRQGETSAKSIESLFSSIDVGDATSIETMLQSIKKLSDQALITEADIKNGLAKVIEKMTDEQFKEFATQAKAAFGEAGEAAKALAGIYQDRVSKTFAALGLDIKKLRGDITENGAKIIESFRYIALDADASGKEIAAAFRAAVNKAETEKELKAIIEAFEQASRAGRLSGENISAAMKDARTRLLELSDSTQVTALSFGDLSENVQQHAQKMQTAVSDVRHEVEETVVVLGEATDKVSEFQDSVRTESAGEFKSMQIDVEAIADDAERLQDAMDLVNSEYQKVQQSHRQNSIWSQKYITGPMLEELSDIRRAIADAQTDLNRKGKSNQSSSSSNGLTSTPAETKTFKIEMGTASAVVSASPANEAALEQILAKLSTHGATST